MSWLGLAPLAALLGGCIVSAAPVVRLVPATSSPVVWRDGRGIFQREAAGVRAAVAFESQEEAVVKLRLEVENTGDTPLEIAPTALAYRTCPDASRCGPELPVVDPERQLLALDRERSRERASQVSDAHVNGTLMLLSSMSAIATLGSGDRRATDRALAESERTRTRAVREDDLHERRLARLDAERAAWSVEPLRRTTLAPGEAVAGAVLFPADVRARYVWLRVPARGQALWFRFQQDVYASDPATASGGAPAGAQEGSHAPH